MFGYNGDDVGDDVSNDVTHEILCWIYNMSKP